MRKGGCQLFWSGRSFLECFQTFFVGENQTIAQICVWMIIHSLYENKFSPMTKEEHVPVHSFVHVIWLEWTLSWPINAMEVSEMGFYHIDEEAKKIWLFIHCRLLSPWIFFRVQLHKRKRFHSWDEDPNVSSRHRGFPFCLRQEEQTRGPAFSQYHRCKPPNDHYQPIAGHTLTNNHSLLTITPREPGFKPLTTLLWSQCANQLTSMLPMSKYKHK